ncbi:hypothetical protein QQF64_034893 [Cirrhinus molitorella]|uniref:Uncharacterized protein n=1 Tax=Cirrhinus molitorella TaxID=172907 RepID=A0ABR3NE74_9TELE
MTCNKCQPMDEELERVSEKIVMRRHGHGRASESPGKSPNESRRFGFLLVLAVTPAFRAFSCIPSSLEELKNWLHGVSCFPSSR